LTLFPYTTLFRSLLLSHPRLALTGSSLAGNGLAGVVGRSHLEASRTL
jgi:hypothetical protein